MWVRYCHTAVQGWWTTLLSLHRDYLSVHTCTYCSLVFSPDSNTGGKKEIVLLIWAKLNYLVYWWLYLLLLTVQPKPWNSIPAHTHTAMQPKPWNSILAHSHCIARWRNACCLSGQLLALSPASCFYQTLEFSLMLAGVTLTPISYSWQCAANNTYVHVACVW